MNKLTWQQALKAAASMALVLAVLLMHSQVADASMSMPATGRATATSFPGAMSKADAGSMDVGMTILLGAHVAMGYEGASRPTLVSGSGQSTPSPVGCAGHGSTCTATVHQPGVTVLPPPACLTSTLIEPAGAVGTSRYELVARAPDPPTPEQALLQVWRC